MRVAKWLLPLVALLALLLVAAACDEDEEPTTPGATGTPGAGASPTAGAQAPAEQQEIVVQSGQPEFFDPHRSNFEQDIAIARMLWRGLYQLQVGADGGIEAVPAMADGEPTVSGNVYTVKLKSGLKWSDGVAMTAADFVYGVQRECDAAVASPYQYVLGASILGIVGCDEFFEALGSADEPKTPTPEELQALRDAVGIKAIDDTTLEVTLLAPKPTFTTIMSLWAAFPARQDVIEQFGDKWTDPGNIVTNGPFILTGLTPGAGGEVVLEPNPNWALEPKPALRKLTIKFIDDTEAAFRAFQTGELDITNIPAPEIPTIQADPELNKQFLQVGAARIWSVELQMENEVIAKPEVRLALSRAIDRETLVKVVYNDSFLPATYWLVQGLPGFQGNAAFEDITGYDPEAAKQALADAGYPNGEGFPTLTLTTLDRPDRKAEAEFLQKNWKDILGIDIEIQTVDAKTRSSTFNSENFELFPGGWQNDYPDPENSLIGLFDTDGGNNHYNCSDPDIDAKLAAAGTETDNAARIKLLQEAETLIVTRLCGAIPIYQNAFLYLADSKMGGMNPNGQIDAAMPGNWCAECWYVKAQ
ncbi:MAG TPA: peptide ABC transporter substrate-binding protein [Dehalococcoidia bacterium]|nr:peptide ABC transporter substrate-binding protein [Dehalococcoidia bacterium]